MKFVNRLFFLCLLLTSFSPSLLGQTDPAIDWLYKKFDTYRRQNLQEKLFVHTDRSFYLTGELMWFRLYCVDGTRHQPLDVSKVAYVEILDTDQNPVLQSKLSLSAGGGSGSFFLPASLSSGNYLVRAYTQWMRNFSPDYYFEKSVTIVNPFKPLPVKPVADSAAYDVQFFPEGGNLVGGLASRMAFRATDQSGKGIDFQGLVLSQNNDTIARFRPVRFGIGSFSYTPSGGETYHAVLQLLDGRTITRPLPKVYDNGYVMQLTETANGQVQVTVVTNTDEAEPVYLFVHARQVVAFSGKQSFKQNQATFLIDKQKLGDGISHFTVFDGNRKPVCERLYGKRPTQLLSFDVPTDKKTYVSREKISASIATRNATGKPEKADVSVSVFRLDSLQRPEQTNLINYLWLTSDLRGTVESPDYYLGNPGKETNEALDHLMLTHGWRRFRWEDVLKKDTTVFTYLPELEGHVIRGKVASTRTGAPARNLMTYLSAPGKIVRLYSSRSDSTGLIAFATQDFFGPKEIIAQTDTRQDSTYRLEIASPFSEKYAAYQLPTFALPEQVQQQVQSRSLQMQVQNAYFEEKIDRFAQPSVDSAAFYGTPDERYFLDDFTRFPVMEEVLREYVTGALPRKRKGEPVILVYDKSHDMAFLEDPTILLDGVPVFDVKKIMAFDPRKVQRLDVLTRRYFTGPLYLNGCVSFSTYKGDLAGFPLDARALVMEYEGMQLSREFYTPQYDTPAQVASRLPDFRNLLHWSPRLLTDAQGNAPLSFFTSDVEGTYAIVVNGLSANGQAGSQVFTFEVKNPVR